MGEYNNRLMLVPSTDHQFIGDQPHINLSLVPRQSTPSEQGLQQHPASKLRRILSDDDRKQMCQFHEKNPKSKQKEIGVRFGVERSTVSKVLRNKKRWLSQKDRSGSLPTRTDHIKKEKGKRESRLPHASPSMIGNYDNTESNNDIRLDSTIRKASEGRSPGCIRPFLRIPHTSSSANLDSPIDQNLPSVSASVSGPFSSAPLAPSSSAEAPGLEIAARNLGMDVTMPLGTLYQGRINPDPSLGFAGNDISSPAYPSQDEARWAAKILLNWMQNVQPGIFCSSEVAMVAGLMETLGQRWEETLTYTLPMELPGVLDGNEEIEPTPGCLSQSLI